MNERIGEADKALFDGPFKDGFPSLIAAAHELKSPLALIRQLSLAIDEKASFDKDSLRAIKQISLTSERALRLTSDLTKAAKLNDALFELEPVNPYELCRDIIFEINPLFEAHGRSIKLVNRRGSLLAVANRDLLRRIVLSFSDNALHYADENGPVEIKIQLVGHGKYVRLSVRDHGPQIIRKSVLVNRPELIVGKRPQSSGLGLYIAKQFAEIMNGQVGAIRHQDGATFFVDLLVTRQLSLI